jgi:hypothetical protein
MKDRKRLLYLKHTWMDVIRLPLILAGIFLLVWIPIYIWNPDPSFWTSGPMIGVYVFGFIVVPGIVAIPLWRIWEAHRDEELWLEGDKLVYKHGRLRLKIEIEDISKIYLVYGNRFDIELRFHLRKPCDGYRVVDFGSTAVCRKWITPEGLERKGMEIWNALRERNPHIELRRFFPKKKCYERWNGREWEKIDWGEIRGEVMGGEW